MKSLISMLLGAGFVLSLSACNISLKGPGGETNVDAGGDSNTTTQSFSYSIEENGCKTGKKTLSNINDYCTTLKDDAANNYCARNSRYEEFKKRCDGISWN